MASLHLANEIFKLIYPVGSIYMSVNSTSPATLFGGTWTELQGRFLLGRSSTYAAGSTGGEATHTLTVAEMPKHNHNMADNDAGYFAGWGSRNGWAQASANITSGGRFFTDYAGNSKPHNNMPPYLSVYMWKRTG